MFLVACDILFVCKIIQKLWMNYVENGRKYVDENPEMIKRRDDSILLVIWITVWIQKF